MNVWRVIFSLKFVLLSSCGFYSSAKNSRQNLLKIWQQDSILVGCIPLAWKPYMLQFQWRPPDVTLGVTKWTNSKQVFSDHHQMSLAGGSPGLISRGQDTLPELSWVVTLPYDLSIYAFDVTYTPMLGTDRCLWKHYLRATSFEGDNDNWL